MVSNFQRDKIARVFAAMDVDGDGYLTENDFLTLTARWTALRGAGDHARLTGVMMGWWASLRHAAAAERVAIGDVLAVVDQLSRMPEAVTGTAGAMFEAVDADGDGRVSPAEYR
jgi:Ca2+-binding EF-hand superfamily protein